MAFKRRPQLDCSVWTCSLTSFDHWMQASTEVCNSAVPKVADHTPSAGIISPSVVWNLGDASQCTSYNSHLSLAHIIKSWQGFSQAGRLSSMQLFKNPGSFHLWHH